MRRDEESLNRECVQKAWSNRADGWRAAVVTWGG